MKHLMPELTTEQREEFILDCEHAIQNEHDEYSPADVLKHQILLASLEAKPMATIHHAKGKATVNWYEGIQDGFTNVFSAQPVAASGPIKLPDGFSPTIAQLPSGGGNSRPRAIMSAAGDWLHRDQVVLAIKAAGGSVQGD